MLINDRRVHVWQRGLNKLEGLIDEMLCSKDVTLP